jgi:hypothetical protein
MDIICDHYFAQVQIDILLRVRAKLLRELGNVPRTDDVYKKIQQYPSVLSKILVVYIKNHRAPPPLDDATRD